LIGAPTKRVPSILLCARMVSMKMFLGLVLIGIIVFVYLHRGSKNQESTATASAQATATPDGSNYFKRPLDRTHEVIDQVKKQRHEDNY